MRHTFFFDKHVNSKYILKSYLAYVNKTSSYLWFISHLLQVFELPGTILKSFTQENRPGVIFCFKRCTYFINVFGHAAKIRVCKNTNKWCQTWRGINTETCIHIHSHRHTHRYTHKQTHTNTYIFKGRQRDDGLQFPFPKSTSKTLVGSRKSWE